MSDLISRQAAIDIVTGYSEQLNGYVGTPNDTDVYAYARGLILGIERNLNALPSTEPDRKKGKWTKYCACEFCGFKPWYERDIRTLSFCPNCGADMRGDSNE